MLKTATLAAILAASATLASAGSGWTKTDLNLRTGPGTGFHVITVVPACDKLHIHKLKHGWYRVSWDGHRGWVAKHFVSGKRCAETFHH